MDDPHQDGGICVAQEEKCHPLCHRSPVTQQARAGWMGAGWVLRPATVGLGKGWHRAGEHLRGEGAGNGHSVGDGAELGCSLCCHVSRTRAGKSHRSLSCMPRSISCWGWSGSSLTPSHSTRTRHPSFCVPCLPLPYRPPAAAPWLLQPPARGVSSCASELSFDSPYL